MKNDPAPEIERAAEYALHLQEAVSGVFVGSSRPVRLATLGLLAGLHVLVEDIPGVGKTTLALALARAAGADFSRIQFTPDLLPGDVIGMNVWDAGKREFVYKPGPINASFVLADELNRAPPRTQSAFLEAMQEGRTTVDGRAVVLPSPFFMMATENPQNFGGTFPLPEAELDRFGLSFSIGYPSQSDEEELLDRWRPADAAAEVRPVPSPWEGAPLSRCREAILGVHVAPAVRSYIVAIARATRSAESIRAGASPRATAALQHAARAEAALKGRAFVIPEDVESVAVAALRHRLVLSSQARLSGMDADRVVAALVASVPKPTGL
jgi:MoxR-like ATPase